MKPEEIQVTLHTMKQVKRMETGISMRVARLGHRPLMVAPHNAPRQICIGVNTCKESEKITALHQLLGQRGRLIGESQISPYVPKETVPAERWKHM